MAASSWTPAEDAVLREMWTAGAAIRVIADALNRTEKSVKGRRPTIGLPQRDPWMRAGRETEAKPHWVAASRSTVWSEDELAMLNGKSSSDIPALAKAIGRSESAVHKKMSSLGMLRLLGAWGTSRELLNSAERDGDGRLLPGSSVTWGAITILDLPYPGRLP